MIWATIFMIRKTSDALIFFEFQPNSLILAPQNKLYEEDLYIDTCCSCDFRLRRD